MEDYRLDYAQYRAHTTAIVSPALLVCSNMNTMDEEPVTDDTRGVTPDSTLAQKSHLPLTFWLVLPASSILK